MEETKDICCVPSTPLVEGDRAKLTTTLNRLKKVGACTERYRHLVQALGGVSFDHDAPINLLTILEHNGVEDCLWALCATAENCERQARLIAADCAESVLHLYERDYPGDRRPRTAIEVTRSFARGEVTAAAWAAAGAAAWAAAWAAAGAAAGDAAWAAAGAAAGDAAGDTQAQIIRHYLLTDEEAPMDVYQLTQAIIASDGNSVDDEGATKQVINALYRMAEKGAVVKPEKTGGPWRVA